ncbi:hypothetical protein R6V09_15610 [Streptomyces sp. W16]|uniref:hypothetical protein n=1 Tax=Streptomyces sp. W16 TaxID=3076631 RepID=UPI00295BD571|nr:hypothetical protein [Streptomyces sp. W16]MDV9171540.1 hypothetical protein [Streptomyces sp. W16]
MKKRHLAATVAAALVLLGLSVPSAQAETDKCNSSQSKRVALPNKSDLDIDVTLCVVRTTDNKVFAFVQFSTSAATLPAAVGRKFDGFTVNARLEYRFSTGGVDYINQSRTCDFTASVNDKWAGTGTCTTPSTTWDGDLCWSADGQIHWDIDGDGKSWQDPWQLTGSPLLS